MNGLENYSKDELEREIKRREAFTELEKIVPLENPDFSCVKDEAIKIMDAFYENSYIYEDSQHYLYEDVMKAVFGKDVFKRMNEVAKYL
jgi:hypothetical protein